MIQADPTLITDIRDDLREECSKFGEVKKVLIFDVSACQYQLKHCSLSLSSLQRHVDGVASVAFKEFESAEAAIGVMNGRYYAGKQLEVSLWDGFTNYQVSGCS